MRPALTLFLLLASIAANSQIEKIIIPAGTPEDQAVQAITNEVDAQKRVAMWQDFLQKFSSNPQAVAYGNWQLSQQYLEQGDAATAFKLVEKAMAVQPNNLDLLVSAATVAQKVKDDHKAVEYAARGGVLFNAIAKQPRPPDMDDEHFAAKIQTDQDPLRSSYEFLEASGINALGDQADAKTRMADIERFVEAFPNTRFQEQLMQLAVYTVGQTKDYARLPSLADKATAANPKSITTLVILANVFADLPEPANVTRAESYARKALDLSGGQAKGDEQAQLQSGLAHSALGYCLLKQNKLAPAIAELKTASAQLKGNPEPYSLAVYRLGYAYARSNRVKEAEAALREVAGMQGPYQQPAREMLTKIETAARKTAAR